MKKIYFVTAFAVFCLGMAPISASAAVTLVVIDPERTALQAKIMLLQNELNALLGVEVKENKKQNLSISSTRLLKTEIDGGAEEVVDQRITILAKNNRHGGKELSDARFQYMVTLYEVLGKKRVKLDHTFTGFALAPIATINSEFRVEVGSERYVSDEDRTFVAKVEIDSDRTFKETSEKDNTHWTDEWTITGNE